MKVAALASGRADIIPQAVRELLRRLSLRHFSAEVARKDHVGGRNEATIQFLRQLVAENPQDRNLHLESVHTLANHDELHHKAQEYARPPGSLKEEG